LFRIDEICNLLTARLILTKKVILFDFVFGSVDMVHVNTCIEMGEIDALDGSPDVCCFVRRGAGYYNN
jgi:hypothetical protein